MCGPQHANKYEKLRFWKKWIFWNFDILFFWKMLKHGFWASLICFLSDFEHGVEFWIFLIFRFRSIFFVFGSKTLKTHQNDGFRSRGPSKNARGYRFHSYKWSNHHISIDFWISFNLLCLRRPKSIFKCKSFNLLCLRRPKSSFFLYCSYSPGSKLKS